MLLPKIFSIIMPALNAEATIEKTLISIKNQDFDQDRIEILVVDGGSEDNTRTIAKKYGAKIIENKKRKPEFAKHIGLQSANGQYVVFMDADEDFADRAALKKRLKFFESEPEIKNIVPAGLLMPRGYAKTSRYMNMCGDAFSYFVYRIDGEDYGRSLEKKYQTKKSKAGLIVNFKKGDLLPIVDAGTHTFDFEYLKTINKGLDLELIPVIFEKMAQKTKSLGLIPNDFVYHNSNTTLGTLLKKTRWKIIGNIFFSENPSSGFSNREGVSSQLKTRKLLFIPYAGSILLPFIDAILLSVRKRDFSFMVHFISTEYILFLIVYYYLLRTLGLKPSWGDYGK